MHDHFPTRPRAAYLRLAVDNSGRFALDEKRGIKLDPTGFTLAPHFLIDTGPIWKTPKRFPVAHTTGRSAQETRHRRGAAQQVNDFSHRHEPIFSGCLKKVKLLEREMIRVRANGNMDGMEPLNQNPRSVDRIALRLLQTRLAMGLNQTEFCERANLAKNTYNQWEKAKGRPEIDKAFQLCDAFNLTLDWIYSGNLSGLPYELATKIGKIRAVPQSAAG